MKTVFMTIGPRGAGKSTFCKKVLASHPDIKYIDRDKIIKEVSPYENSWPDGYAFTTFLATERLWGEITQALENGASNTTVLLDCWNPGEQIRKSMLCKLRELGAEKIIGLYFITPEETTARWFVDREHSSTSCEAQKEEKRQQYVSSYRSFHEYAQDVRDGKGFDAVWKINPLQRELFPDFIRI